MPSSKVAIIMRTKDRPQLLKRAISSACQQTFKNWQLCIINDGGDPAAVQEVTKSFHAQASIEILHLNPSRGMAEASNLGLKHTTSEYIALLDDDDTWEPTFLAETVTFLDQQDAHSKTKGVATYTNAICESLTADEITIHSKKRYALQPAYISFANLLLENQFTNLSFVYRREVLDAIGLYNQDLTLFDDWEFNLRFALKYDIALLPSFLANYHFRLHSKNGMATAQNSLGLKPNKEALLAHFRDYLLRQDLERASFGIGTLMHLSHQQLKAMPANLSLLRALKYDCRWLYKKIKAKLWA